MDVHDVDDEPLTARQFGRGRLRQKEGRLQIATEQITPVLERDVPDRRRVKRRRVIDQNIETAKHSLGMFDQRAELFDFKQIETDHGRAIGANGIQGASQFICGSRRAMAMNQNIGAMCVQVAHDLRSDSSCSAGHQGGFALQGLAACATCWFHGELL